MIKAGLSWLYIELWALTKFFTAIIINPSKSSRGDCKIHVHGSISVKLNWIVQNLLA